ncbi:MAG: hypothetical protein PUI25_05285, partial [Spirochaetales bacterium]|nr:hypothetical protein [Spirochaetales bacterium]
IDRKYKKDSFYAYKAWLSDEPFVHLASKRYVDRVEDETKVTVYSNLPEVSLYVNGELFETKSAEDHFFRFTVPNKGETVLKAVAGDFSDEGVIRKVEVFNEAYRLREKGAILNWFDITEREGYCSLNTKISDIMSSFRGKLVLTLFIASRLRKIKKKNEDRSSSAMKPSSDMMKMIGSFTPLRVSSMAGMIGLKFTKEDLLGLNRKLNRVKLKTPQ